MSIITQIIIILTVLSLIVLLVKKTILYKKPIQCKCIKYSTIVKYNKGAKTTSKVCKTCDKTMMV